MTMIIDHGLCPKGEHCDVRAVPRCNIFYVFEATSWSSLFPPSMHFLAAPFHNNKLQLRRGETTRKTPFFAPKQCHGHGSARRLLGSVREKTKPKCQSSSFKPDQSSDWDFVRRKKKHFPVTLLPPTMAGVNQGPVQPSKCLGHKEREDRQVILGRDRSTETPDENCRVLI